MVSESDKFLTGNFTIGEGCIKALEDITSNEGEKSAVSFCMPKSFLTTNQTSLKSQAQHTYTPILLSLMMKYSLEARELYSLIINFTSSVTVQDYCLRFCCWDREISLVSPLTLSHCWKTCQVLVTERSKIWRENTQLLNYGSKFPFQCITSILGSIRKRFTLQEIQPPPPPPTRWKWVTLKVGETWHWWIWEGEQRVLLTAHAIH